MRDKINNFSDLDAWKINHRLVLDVYKTTKDFPKDERYGIINQLRRAASSITANVAEGWGRYHYADRIRFYYNARGSSCEVQNFLVLSRDLGYLSSIDYQKLYLLATKGLKIINGLIRSVEKLKIK
ncbi:four helix bundle protein [Candidatus Shapirobacteria bacterium]|nr:four helix bundle protein [Candidatus Shapirobacteria bacterium]